MSSLIIQKKLIIQDNCNESILGLYYVNVTIKIDTNTYIS